MKRIKKVFCLLMSVLFVSGVVGPMTVKADDVTASRVIYTVTFDEAVDVLLSNRISIGNKVGTEVYMTYTVENVKKCEKGIQGVVATNVPTEYYPYATGQLDYNDGDTLLKEGYTYFYKFEVTKTGFKYTIAKAKGNDATYVKLPFTTGEKKGKMEHFGLWLGNGKVTATLNDVRFYDKNGIDLGVQFSPTDAATSTKNVSFSKNSGLNHTYQITAKEQGLAAISNAKKPTSDVVYMEYQVESVNAKLLQTGIILSEAPTDLYPFTNGYMQYESTDKAGTGRLLKQGAEYIIRMEKNVYGLSATVQCTYKGEKEVFEFETSVGTYDKQDEYFSLWFSEATSLDFVLKNFKCYDSNNNNLGVQCNVPFSLEHVGELEDYTGCEAVYYCEENGSVIALYADQSMKYTEGGKTRKGNYSVDDKKDKIITLSYDEGKEIYEYYFRKFTDENGRVYKRLGTYVVSFETGNDTVIEEQVLSAKTGYKVMKPAEPEMVGCTFKGWYTSDGVEFDFDAITTESTTLYAKWEGEQRENTAVKIAGVDINNNDNYLPIILAVLVLSISAGCSVLLMRGGKKNEEHK